MEVGFALTAGVVICLVVADLMLGFVLVLLARCVSTNKAHKQSNDNLAI